MKIFKILVASVFVISLAACKTTAVDNSASTETKTEKKVVEKAPRAENSGSASGSRVIDGSDAPAGSKFSKLKLGMAAQQIVDTIGQPTDRKSYYTAKAWLPFYFGPDSSRREYIYKGEGRLTIGGNGRLIGIVVDPAEDGYR